MCLKIGVYCLLFSCTYHALQDAGLIFDLRVFYSNLTSLNPEDEFDYTGNTGNGIKIVTNIAENSTWERCFLPTASQESSTSLIAKPELVFLMVDSLQW